MTAGTARRCDRARSVASTSPPANTVVRCVGRTACWRTACAMPGRAFPAAQPHTEFTTMSVVPLALDGFVDGFRRVQLLETDV